MTANVTEIVAGIRIPDTTLAKEATALLREHSNPLLHAHSLRVFLCGESAAAIYQRTNFCDLIAANPLGG